jgi:hypothetical protein
MDKAEADNFSFVLVPNALQNLTDKSSVLAYT